MSSADNQTVAAGTTTFFPLSDVLPYNVTINETCCSMNTSLSGGSQGKNDRGSQKTTVHDISYDTEWRLAILYIQIVVGILGALMLFCYMFHARRLTRVNALILNLCVSDLAVILFSCLFQLVWEHFDRRWMAGDAMCRIFKMFQIFVMCASTNMLVVIAVDRHQAITAPLRKQFSVVVMVSVGWGVAFLCTLPVVYVFNERYDEVKNKTVCENIFRFRPRWHRQLFLTYAAFVNFLIPLIILCTCYVRIFIKIARKASESRRNKRQSFKPGKIHLTSNTTSATLQSAKLKTLRMTVVIVSCFIVFGMPYFIVEMIMSYGDFLILSNGAVAILGGIAVANSAVNPYIFLLFSVNYQCLRSLKLCPVQTGPNNRQLMYNGSVRSREYFTATSRTPVTNVSSSEALELTTTTETLASKQSRMAGYNSRWLAKPRQ